MTTARRILLALLVLVCLYLGTGFAFHLKWKSELAACREAREAQGEFVEPEVFGGVLGLVFNVTNWPVYVRANVNLDGTPFATPCTHSQNAVASGEEETVGYLVESFGKCFQEVSLQSPNAAQAIRKQYAGFVTPELLKTWENYPSRAPGRVVSSPWPDHIEITALVKGGVDKYTVNGFVIEVTSVELANGGAAARIPVRIVVEKQMGRWLISEYAEDR